MASVNRVILIGNLGKDPDSRYSASGDAVCTLSIATSEQWKDKATGEKKEAVEWHRVTTFGKLAEICGQYLKKGSQVYIEGSLRTNKWKDKDGQDRYTTEIRADTMKMLGGSTGSQPKEQDKKPAPAGGFEGMEDDIPFLFNMNTVCDIIGTPNSLWRSQRGKNGKAMLLLRSNKID